jgi:acyl-CoA synthetase (AMP-forming)/AMP-acid ligase II
VGNGSHVGVLYPNGSGFAVAALAAARIGAVVVPFDVLDDGAAFDETAVRARLRTQLSAYQAPRRLAVMRRDEVPLRAGGKVDTAALKKVFDA